MSIEIFMMLLLLISTLTGLVTEAVKVHAADYGRRIKPNTTAGIVAIVTSAGVAIAYVLFTGQIVTIKVIVSIVALVFMSWLCAMVGYDKVVQTLAQMRDPERM